MPLPPVVVEISAQDASAELRETLLDACTRAVQDTTCTEGSGLGMAGPDPDSVAAVAIVSWQSDGTVRLEVGREPSRPWHTRLLRFDQEEDHAEVFTAVGFAIGALVGRFQEEKMLGPLPPTSVEGPAAKSPSSEPPPPAPPPDLLPQVVPPTPVDPGGDGFSGGWSSSADFLLGSGRSYADWRIGGAVGLGWVHRSGAVLGGSVSYAVSLRRDDEPRYRWFGVGGGLGREFNLGGGIGLTCAGQLGVERFLVRATALDTGLEEEASRWVGFAQARAQLVVPTDSPIAGVLGVGATGPFGRTDVAIRDQRLADPAPLRLTVSIGLRHDGRTNP